MYQGFLFGVVHGYPESPTKELYLDTPCRALVLVLLFGLSDLPDSDPAKGRDRTSCIVGGFERFSGGASYAEFKDLRCWIWLWKGLEITPTSSSNEKNTVSFHQ